MAQIAQKRDNADDGATKRVSDKVKQSNGVAAGSRKRKSLTWDE